MKDRSDDPPHHERTLYLWATSRFTPGGTPVQTKGDNFTTAWSSLIEVPRSAVSTGHKVYLSRLICILNRCFFVCQTCMIFHHTFLYKYFCLIPDIIFVHSFVHSCIRSFIHSFRLQYDFTFEFNSTPFLQLLKWRNIFNDVIIFFFFLNK